MKQQEACDRAYSLNRQSKKAPPCGEAFLFRED
jgi:hypothetical protein